MYRITYDGLTIFDPYGNANEVVSDASMSVEANASAYLDFTMAMTHPLYDTIRERAGVVTLTWDSTVLFEGIIESIEMDIQGNKSISCVSAMDYLNDTHVRPYSTVAGEEDLTAPSSVDGYFQWLIDQHNDHVLDASKMFDVGINQGANLQQNNFIYRSSESEPTTASELTDQILDSLGGYLTMRYEDGRKVLDLYADLHTMNAQIVDFGVNITDFTKTTDTTDQYTAILLHGGSPTFEGGDLEGGDWSHWATHPNTPLVGDKTHGGSVASYFVSGTGEYINDSFFYSRPGRRYKATVYVKNERGSNVTIRGSYQYEQAGGWTTVNVNSSMAVENKDDQWTEFSFDFQPNLSEYTKIRPRWYFDNVGNDGNRRVYLDDFSFSQIEGDTEVSEDPIGLKQVPDGVSSFDADVFKTGDVLYSTSAVERYGYKEEVFEDSTITNIDDLVQAGIKELNKSKDPQITLDIKAVDLALFMEGYTHLNVGDAVRVRSAIHDTDEFLMVNSITLDLQDPGQSEYVIGTAYDTLTGQQSGYLKSLNAGINSSLDSVASLDQSVKDQAVQIGSVEQIANDAKDTADNAQNTANSAQQAAQDAQNSASSALDKAEAAEGAVNEIQEMVDDINSGAEQAKQDAAQAKADAQQAAAKADAASQAAQAAANKADALEGSVTDVTTTVNGVVQDIEEITTSVTGAISTANEALSAASSASQDLEGFKTTVSQTYQLKGDYATNTDLDEAIAEEVLNRNSAIEQSASSITSTVSQTYATKTDLAVTDGKAAQAQSAAQQAQTSASNAQSTANAANNTANGVAEDLTDYMETVATTYASKSELKQTSESITATVEANYTEVKQLANTAQSTADSALSKANEASGELADFTESVTGDLADLQDQIDGSIATWFYAGTPTLTNEPAVNWTTTEEKNQHLGDLYYDTNNGYAWRFMVQNGSYSWGRITDSDVTKALEDAANAQDTADSKRRVFVSQPTPPYDVGDLWVQGENGDILRCAAPRASGSYVAGDWALASKYTDDSALEIFEGQVADIYSTKAELETATDAITATVEENFEKSVLVKEADGGIIDCGDTAGMPLAGLTVYGQTRQNLWANPSYESSTINGITYSNNSNGTMTFSGTATANRTISSERKFILKPGTQYTVQVDRKLADTYVSGNADGACFFVTYATSEGAYISDVTFGYGTLLRITFTTPSNLGYCSFNINISQGTTVSGTYRVMLNEGSEAEPWCPPGLNSVEGLSLVTAGKNLLPIETIGRHENAQVDSTFTSEGITWKLNPDGTINANGTATANTYCYVKFNNFVLPPGTYTRNGSISGFTTEDDNIRDATFTLDRPRKISSAYVGVIRSGSKVNTTIYPQLEIGSTATAYEPPAVITTPIDLLGNKVSSLPDGTRDELVVDAGGNVVLRKRAVELTAPSSESSWGDELENNRIYTPISQAADFDINESYLHAFCDKLPLRSSGFNRSRTETYLSPVYLYAQYGDAVDKSTMVSRISGGEYIYRSALRLIPLGTVDLPDLPETNAHLWISTGTQGLDPDIHATWYGENASALKDFASKAELKVESDQIKATVEETYSTKEEVSAVEDKADAAQDALDSYKETVSTTYATKSEVTQTANSIKSEVSETYTTKEEFNGLEVGGRNLVSESGDFPDELSLWKINGGTSIGVTTEDSYRCIEAVGSIAQPNSIYRLDFDSYYVWHAVAKFETAGSFSNTSPLHFWAYKTNDEGGIGASNGAWNIVSLSLYDMGTGAKLSSIPAGVWVHIIGVWKTIPAGTYDYLNFRPFFYGGSAGAGKRYWVRWVKLEKGTKATDWSPAPEDMLSTSDAEATYATKTSVTQTANSIKQEVASSYQPKGDYATSGELDAAIAQEVLDRNSAIEQTADSITATVSQTYTTKAEASAIEGKADAAQTAASSANSAASAAQSTANAAQDALDSYKNTVSTTYATKSEVTQTADSIRSEVSEDYVTKDAANGTYATKTSVSTVEQTVDSLTSTVSSNYTTLNDKFGSYYTKTEVDQKDNSIKSTVSSVQTTANNALEKASTVEQTADGLEVRLTQAEKDVDTAQSTANTASTTANAAKTAAATAQTTANNAAKTATNYLKFDSAGLCVGDMTSGTLGYNTLIKSTGLDIRNGSAVLASFTPTEIALGKNSSSSSIDLCNGLGKIKADQNYTSALMLQGKNSGVNVSIGDNSKQGIIMMGGSTGYLNLQGNALILSGTDSSVPRIIKSQYDNNFIESKTCELQGFVEIYSSSTLNFSNTITLDEPASVFKMLEVFYGNNDKWNVSSSRVWLPDNKRVICWSFTHVGGSNLYIKMTSYLISGAKLTAQEHLDWGVAEGDVTPGYNRIGVYRVLGWF